MRNGRIAASVLNFHPLARTELPALRLTKLRKTFGKVTALDELDLEVRTGECFGLLGPNGAGKTTTIEICEGLTAPDSGTVELLGLNWISGSRELRQRIGLQLQETRFPEKLKVEETLRLFRSFYRQPLALQDVIEIGQLEEKRYSYNRDLSGGQKQRLAMACALVGNPDLIFLDEPTAALDPQARRHLWGVIDHLKRAGRTVILTTHSMDEAERLCDRVAIVDHGKLIALGEPQQLIATLGGDHIVEFATAEPVAASVAELMQLPGVQRIREYAGLHQVAVCDLHSTVPLIFAALTSRKLTMTAFRTHSATLEDVFVELTGRGLRDA